MVVGLFRIVGGVRVRVQFLHTAVGKMFAPISRWYSHHVKMTKEEKNYKQKKDMLFFLTLAFAVSLMSIVMSLSNNLHDLACSGRTTSETD